MLIRPRVLLKAHWGCYSDDRGDFRSRCLGVAPRGLCFYDAALMNVLALEPYYGGSHQAFLDGWIQHSRHCWTLLTLPPYKWKWRMRHAAITFAHQLARRTTSENDTWNIVVTCDMLNLAELMGLLPATCRSLPSVLYFHENQLTYPVQHEDERDYHYAMSHLASGIAATQVWFNSAYHRDVLLEALPRFLDRMPDHQPLHAVDVIREKSRVHSPGIRAVLPRNGRREGPLRILWAARWEHDKAPETFFQALYLLLEQGLDFRVSALGEQFRHSPSVFEEAEQRLGDRVERWGFQDRAHYEEALQDTDVFVSTARHEFFGLSVVEAIAAGAYPLLPNHLSYPEILRGIPGFQAYLYDGSVQDLATRLAALSAHFATGGNDDRDQADRREAMRRFEWSQRATSMDEAIERIALGQVS